MHLDEALKQTAVIGAAGKMGRGISLLLLKEVALLKAKNQENYQLLLIDSHTEGLQSLRPYLRTHLTRLAEKEINLLRQYFAQRQDLISNQEIINTFVEESLNLVQTSQHVSDARNCHLVFEAVIEDLQVKTQLFHQLVDGNTHPVYLFTNTSSIPIHVLNESGDLHERIIGFHFYNPPAVQKLIELIPLEKQNPQLFLWAQELAARMNKLVIPSKDIAGFIGNGFFIREALFATAKAEVLSTSHPMPLAIYLVNQVTEEFLIRPMGIFQLLDFVGLDVAAKIGNIMNAYLSQTCFTNNLIDQMLLQGISGGQRSDGSQKNGFFSYENGTIKGIYSLEKKEYIQFDKTDWDHQVKMLLGSLPLPHYSWRSLTKDKEAPEKLKVYLNNLEQQHSLGAKIAGEFLDKDREITQKLVNDGVAASAEDVGAVLRHGFYHLYSSLDVPCIR